MQHNGQQHQVVLHQQDVCAFACHVCAACGCGGHVGGGEHRGIVDAVAEHEYAAALCLQCLHIGEFIFGGGIGAAVGDAERVGQCAGGGGGVAAQQVQGDAVGAKLGQHIGGAGLGLVLQKEGSLKAVLVGQCGNGAALRGEFRQHFRLPHACGAGGEGGLADCPDLRFAVAGETGGHALPDFAGALLYGAVGQGGVGQPEKGLGGGVFGLLFEQLGDGDGFADGRRQAFRLPGFVQAA